MRIKQFVYQYCEHALLRLPLARWQRILAHDEAEPAFRHQFIKIIYAYVEMHNNKPVYCHRIEAVCYTFDEHGYCCLQPLPDFDLLGGGQEEKVTYLSTKRAQNQYFAERYWQPSPHLLDNILDKIWHDYR